MMLVFFVLIGYNVNNGLVNGNQLKDTGLAFGKNNMEVLFFIYVFKK